MSVKFSGIPTPNFHGESLCRKCNRAAIAMDQNLREYVYCHEFQQPIKRKIVKCSTFEDKTLPTISSFRTIAWTFDTNSTKSPMGFHPPKQGANVYMPGEDD